MIKWVARYYCNTDHPLKEMIWKCACGHQEFICYSPVNRYKKFDKEWQKANEDQKND